MLDNRPNKGPSQCSHGRNAEDAKDRKEQVRTSWLETGAQFRVTGTCTHRDKHASRCLENIPQNISNRQLSGVRFFSFVLSIFSLMNNYY